MKKMLVFLLALALMAGCVGFACAQRVSTSGGRGNVGITGGRVLKQKTFNPRLGVEGARAAEGMGLRL